MGKCFYLGNLLDISSLPKFLVHTCIYLHLLPGGHCNYTEAIAPWKCFPSSCSDCVGKRGFAMNGVFKHTASQVVFHVSGWLHVRSKHLNQKYKQVETKHP